MRTKFKNNNSGNNNNSDNNSNGSDGNNGNEERVNLKDSYNSKSSMWDWWKNRCNEQVEQYKREYFEKESSIFKNIKVYFDGFSGDVSVMHLKKLVFLHGGTHSHWFSPTQCTHIVGTNMSLNKYEQIKKMVTSSSKKTNNSIHYVNPNWILDSCKFKKLQNESNYKLFDESSSFYNSKDIREYFYKDSNNKQDIGGSNINDSDNSHEQLQIDNDNDGIKNNISITATTTTTTTATTTKNKSINQNNKRNKNYSSIIEIDEYSLFSKVKRNKTVNDNELDELLINPSISISNFINNKPVISKIDSYYYNDDDDDEANDNLSSIERGQSKLFQ